MDGFQIAALPRLILEQGGINKLPELILSYGHNVLLVTGEPSPQLVDDAVKKM